MLYSLLRFIQAIRQRLRGKISNEKADLTTSVSLYNDISGNDDLMVDDVVNGIFKWSEESELPTGSKGSYKNLYVHNSVGLL